MTDDPAAPADTTTRPEEAFPARVVLTGATGFVGRAVLRQLVARGHKAVCLVRDRQRLAAAARALPADRWEAVTADLFDGPALAEAMRGADAVIHLVGIIFQRPLAGQSFERVHVEATRNVLEACKAVGVRRIAHMSALGVRPNAASHYHRTKWLAEGLVRESGLDWTIFRPSIIHGPDGEFMRLMKLFVTRATVRCFGVLPAPFPIIPYFGNGLCRVQPVSVQDVAHCFVSCLSMPETRLRTYELGGPKALTWRELYRVCRETIPGALHWKPMVGQPVWAAKLMAATLMKLPILPAMMRFDAGQVQMSQEDSICPVEPVEKTFSIRLRDFQTELREYAALIE